MHYTVDVGYIGSNPLRVVRFLHKEWSVKELYQILSFYKNNKAKCSWWESVKLLPVIIISGGRVDGSIPSFGIFWIDIRLVT